MHALNPSNLTKAQQVLELITYKQDAIARMVETVAEVYGADDQIDEEQFTEKYATLQVLTEVCTETIDPVMAAVAEAYATHYTAAELDQLIAWYASPLGQKVLAESQTLLVSVTAALDKWGTDLWKIVRLRRGWQETAE